jgi:hypothetical protein
MADSPTPSSRFKAEMPNIPGVASASAAARHRNPLLPLIVGMLVLGLVLFLAAHWFSRLPKMAKSAHAEPTPQIEVPSAPPDPNSLLPHANENNPAIGDITNFTKPWTSMDFFIRNTITGENLPATLVRIPTGPVNSPSGYWAFSRKSAYGDCQLEYITDLDKLLKDYDYRHATHPLVGNPCSRTLYDPLKTTNLPGNIWIRGAIVQGGDIRPPLSIEIEIRGKEILATRTE